VGKGNDKGSFSSRSRKVPPGYQSRIRWKSILKFGKIDSRDDVLEGEGPVGDLAGGGTAILEERPGHTEKGTKVVGF